MLPEVFAREAVRVHPRLLCGQLSPEATLLPEVPRLSNNQENMELGSVRKAYRFYAPIYDIVFGRIVDEGRRRAVATFDQKPGDRILEIGVGTGRSLRYYRPDVEVTGIDVSPEMLEKARRYVGPRYPQVKELLQMDAQSLDFPDSSFDGAVAMYVASVVPDPAAMIREMFRVCRPGAPLVVVNHFTSSNRVARRVERRFASLSDRLGFQPDFGLEQFVETVGHPPRRITRVNLGGYWKLLEFASPDGAEAVSGSAESGSHPHRNANGKSPSPTATR